MSNKNVLIIGSGIAGVGAASVLKENGIRFQILEKDSTPGGLCRSFKVKYKGDFTFDMAVHAAFSNNKEFQEFFENVEFERRSASFSNYFHGYWVRHPVIYNLYPLPVSDKVSLIKGLIERKENARVNNYRDYLLASYGERITDSFFELYTKKYWTLSSAEMGTSWIGPRLYSPDLEKILIGAMSEQKETISYASEVRYPFQGGFEAFYNSVTKDIDISLNKTVTEIDIDNQIVKTKEGDTIKYSELISSAPLPELVRMIKGVPEDILEESKKLIATSISLVSVGFNKEVNSDDYLGFYIYDEDIMAARVSAPNIQAKSNAPNGFSSMQFEIYHRNNTKIEKDKILNNVRESLLKMKICYETDILFMDYKYLPYSNPIFWLGMEKCRDNILKWIRENGIMSIGRFGMWDYLWCDQSYFTGKRAAEEIINRK